MYRDLWTFLWSRKLATILLVFLILLATVGAIVPQQSVYPAADFIQWQQDNPQFAKFAIQLKLTNILESSLFIGCSLLLCMSLLLCTLRRMFQLISGREEKKEFEDLDRSPQNSLSICSDSDAEQIVPVLTSLLKKQRFTLLPTESTTLCAVRGRWGAFGSLLFHFSFLILFVGAVLSTWARFEGTFNLTEGQSFRGLPGEYSFEQRRPLVSKQSLPFQLNFEQLIRVDEPEPHYRNLVSVQEESGERFDAIIRPFHALTYRGYTFYQGDRGFSPSLVFTKKDGRVLFDAFVSIQTRRLGDTVIFEDYFKVPGMPMTVQLRLYPDADIVDGVIVSRTTNPDNPVLEVKSMVEDNVFFEGSVKLGETVDTGDFTIEFKKVNYWSSFRVVKDSGLPIIYASFVVGILGYFLRLFSIREVIKVRVLRLSEGTQLVVTGRTEQNGALFAEKFETIVSTLRQGVAEV